MKLRLERKHKKVLNQGQTALWSMPSFCLKSMRTFVPGSLIIRTDSQISSVITQEFYQYDRDKITYLRRESVFLCLKDNLPEIAKSGLRQRFHKPLFRWFESTSRDQFKMKERKLE